MTHAMLDELFEREYIDEEEYGKAVGYEGRDEQVKFWERKRDLVRRPEKRPLSKLFKTFFEWMIKSPAKSSAYRRRIEGYMRRHPGASLKEARGHG